MNTTVRKWGNSQGVRLSKELLAEARINIGEPVEVVVHDGSLVITPTHRVRGRVDLAELVKRLPDDPGADAVDWGAPVGREEW